jgi:hypothetical protein
MFLKYSKFQMQITKGNFFHSINKIFHYLELEYITKSITISFFFHWQYIFHGTYKMKIYTRLDFWDNS